ncbi:ANKRD17, partial [Symbiodinium necroappetens]
MLRVRMISGEEVASILLEKFREEPCDVKSLKRRLSQLKDMPPRFRQRLLLRGQTFEDTANLDSAMDLELVLMPFPDVSEAQVNDLAAAAEQGFVNEVESMLRLPQDPNSHDWSGFTALMR